MTATIQEEKMKRSSRMSAGTSIIKRRRMFSYRYRLRSGATGSLPANAGAAKQPIGDAQEIPQSAFSLIELVAILAIIAILGALVAPRFSKSLTVQRADALARRMVFDLAYAQQYAKSTGTAQTVRFRTDDYELLGATHFDRTDESYLVDVGAAPYYGAILSVVFDSGDDTITFDAYGVPDTGGTILIGVGDQRRTIAVDPITGKGEIQ